MWLTDDRPASLVVKGGDAVREDVRPRRPLQHAIIRAFPIYQQQRASERRSWKEKEGELLRKTTVEKRKPEGERLPLTPPGVEQDVSVGNAHGLGVVCHV